MPTPTTAELLKYADLQMAAEAFLSNDSGIVKTGVALTNALTDGNFHASKFTDAQATAFLDPNEGWTVLNQKANTATGFSGTLFRSNKTGELVISMRSTEFVDDAARDSKATNELEVKKLGWAFGQIDDMEKWYAELNASPSMLQGQSFAVTGYSLGGHVATAFNLLRSEQGQASRITSTYTFNGAGVGEVIGASAAGLSYVMQQFQSMRQNGNADFFTHAVSQSAYQHLRPLFAASATTALNAADVAAAITYVQSRYGALNSQQTPEYNTAIGIQNAELQLLEDALVRIRDITSENARVALLRDSSGSSPVVPTNSAFNVAGLGLDYQLAVLRSSKDTRGFNTSVLAAAWQALPGGRNVLPGLNNFYDVVGSNFKGDDYSAVSNSQHHYGTATPVYIEDQPLKRGDAVWEAFTQTALYINRKKIATKSVASLARHTCAKRRFNTKTQGANPC